MKTKRFDSKKKKFSKKNKFFISLISQENIKISNKIANIETIIAYFYKNFKK